MYSVSSHFIDPRRGLLTGFSVVALLLGGCSGPVLPADYRAYLADPAHGLIQTRETAGATVTCAYRPVGLQVLQELTTAPPTATPDSLARAYAGKTYFSLSISRNGGEIENALVNDEVAYRAALAYLNTGIAADMYLATTPRDSVAAQASIYLRQYGTTGATSVLLAFDTRALTPAQGFTVTWRDPLFGLGTQRFRFTADDLAALPAVRYQ